MEKTEFRVLIKHCFLMGKNTVQAKQWIDKCYPDSCPSKATICRWFAEFKRGRTDTNDAERSGRPVEAVTPENVSEVTKIIMKDRKVKLREIAEMTQISYGSVFTILHEKLSMKKVFSKWVPRLLSMEQKQQRVDDSESCLSLFTRNKKDLAPSDYWLFADLKKVLQGKRFGSNEVIAETEAYFEAKDNFFYKHGIEKLEKRWNDCITLKGDYVNE
nr:protein GVQW3-like [Parasteatoda tepidariorum]